jgi:hypothetical protein
MPEEGSTGFCAVEDWGCIGDAKAMGALPNASEAKTTAAMKLFFIPVCYRLTR